LRRAWIHETDMNHNVLAGVHLLLALQGGQATVSGVIRDGDGNRAIAGAVVALTELDRAVMTDADGRYVIAGVPAGPHHIVARRIGYAPRSLHALVPVTGTLEINITLSLLPVPARLPTVTVLRPVELRGSAVGDSVSLVDETASMAALRNSPLLTEPDVFQSLSGGEITVKPESPGGVHIRGGASDHTSYVIDGIPVFNPYHTSGVFSAWNPDALSHVTVASAMPLPAHPSTLSGTVAAVTRTPGSQMTSRASVSTTHTGVTLDGPLGFGDAGYLVSVRVGYPHFTAPNDPSYLRGSTGDRLAKLEVPALGGRLKLLGYHGVNEIGTAAATEAEVEPRPQPRNNTFEWQSRSLGFEWSRAFPGTKIRLLGWSAAGDAESIWTGRVSRLNMTADRRDEGLLVVANRTFVRSSVNAGGRFERSRSSYVVHFDSGGINPFGFTGREPFATLFAHYAAAMGKRAHVRIGSSVTSAAGSLHTSPQAEVRWTHSSRLTSSASYARVHQFAQSLRNPESVTAGVFPADLFASAGSPGIPVARSDVGVVATTYRPTADTRIAVQAWQRGLDNVVIVAPFDDEPFATKPFGIGRGTSRGASFEASVASTRYGITASYGIQRVRYSSGSLDYVPDHGPTHLFEGGVIFFPSATFSVRVGVAHSAGRRTTAVGGSFEWEACNLLDRGCEFSGSPRANGEPLGEQYLPPYLRFDIGARKHWHADVAGRDATITLFAALTNVFDRKNVLTYARVPATGTLSPIDMRPRAPLVVGMEWRL